LILKRKPNLFLTAAKQSPLKENDQRKNAGKAPHVCELVDLENADLKKKLIRTKRALEETYSKLKLSNERKEIIEKDIRQQILKTQNVMNIIF
jgi:centrosomin